MQDRVATYPNRWKLTPVTGETNVYDFERADEPVVAGTPLNKATFLPDTVAAAVAAATGISGITLPADALNAIAAYITAVGSSSYINRVVTGSYVGTGGTSTTKTVTLTFPFNPKFVVVVRENYAMNINSPTYCIGWMYGLDRMASSVPVTYNDDNVLSWSCSGLTADDRPINRMDVSGVTYYYIAMGVEE